MHYDRANRYVIDLTRSTPGSALYLTVKYYFVTKKIAASFSPSVNRTTNDNHKKYTGKQRCASAEKNSVTIYGMLLSFTKYIGSISFLKIPALPFGSGISK